MMNQEERGFHAAMKADPRENTIRVVYADWLDEHDRPLEAEAYRRGIHINSPFESLIGKKVLGVKIQCPILVIEIEPESEEDSRFISYDAQGDCCSHSWFYRVLNADQLIGAEVLSIMAGKTDDVDPEDGLGTQESEAIYGYSIMTTKGVCEITFRNSSNGYYGGWIDATQNDILEASPAEVITTSWCVPIPQKMSCASAVEGCFCNICVEIGAGNGKS